METIRPGRGNQGSKAPSTKAPNGCESSGTKHNRARMFLTWYQVNARHPRAESLLKKTGKIAELTGEFKNTYWNLLGQNAEIIQGRITM